MEIKTLIRKNKWKVINSCDLDESAAFASHVSYSNDTVDFVNKFCHPIRTGRSIDDYRVGDELLGKPTKKKAYTASDGSNIYISSNSIYTIAEFDIETGYAVMECGDDRTFRYLISEMNLNFKRPWCSTAHSAQGLSLGKKLYIHNLGCYMADSRWYFTAITRCETLDIIFVLDNKRY